MKLTLDILRRFTPLPEDPRQTRVLLDEVGLEVKRIDFDAPGVPVTLELLANRGDHHSLTGLAVEVSGRTGGGVCSPEGLALTPTKAPHPMLLTTPLCPVYSLTELTLTGEPGSLSAEALEVLEAAGLQSVDAMVDATNVANLELGQPTHAFDADTIVGTITIRTTTTGEQAWPLFAEKKVTLPEGTLVIADEEKILAIAGVIGCEESKTTENTTRVLLESAAFDPVAVRKASRALSIFTDSSARFERGSDFSAPLKGAGRVAALVKDAGWTVGATGIVGEWHDPKRTVPFDPEAARRFLDIRESDEQLAERLRRYGFEVPASGPTEVGVPPHRLWDVEYPADLYEELAKSIGYDNTPIGLPPVDMGQVPSNEELVLHTVEEVLLGHGFYEVITDGFYSRGLREQLGFGDEGHPLFDHVETANALDRAYSLLKNNALGQALEGVAMNLRANHPQIKAFEFTTTFHPDPASDNGVCTERSLLWGIVNGSSLAPSWSGPSRAADALFLKGVLAEIGVALSLPLSFGPADDYPLASALHPNRRRGIYLGSQRIGVFGEVHPEVVKRFKIKRARPTYFEIAVEPLFAEGQPHEFVEPSRLQDVVRNLAFTLPGHLEAEAISATLREQGPEWLKRVDVVDLYRHEEDGQAVRTLTYALTYTHDLGERSADEMNATSEALIAAVVAAHGDRGVKLR